MWLVAPSGDAVNMDMATSLLIRQAYPKHVVVAQGSSGDIGMFGSYWTRSEAEGRVRDLVLLLSYPSLPCDRPIDPVSDEDVAQRQGESRLS